MMMVIGIFFFLLSNVDLRCYFDHGLIFIYPSIHPSNRPFIGISRQLTTCLALLCCRIKIRFKHEAIVFTFVRLLSLFFIIINRYNFLFNVLVLLRYSLWFVIIFWSKYRSANNFVSVLKGIAKGW